MVEEINKILLSEDVSQSIRNNIDLILNYIPEIKYMIGFDQKNPGHYLDVFEHTLYALNLSDKDIIIRMTLLLHDIGKPFCFTEGEIRRFKGHSLKSYEMALVILKRLGYDDDFINIVTYLILNHDYPISKSLIENNNDVALMLFKVQLCDCYAHSKINMDKREKYLIKTLYKIIEKR